MFGVVAEGIGAAQAQAAGVLVQPSARLAEAVVAVAQIAAERMCDAPGARLIAIADQRVIGADGAPVDLPGKARARQIGVEGERAAVDLQPVGRSLSVGMSGGKRSAIAALSASRL